MKFMNKKVKILAIIMAVITIFATSVAYAANETYTVDGTILFKIIHKNSIPFMSAFEVGTSFFNAKSLTTNHYLTWGHNTLEYLKNYPMITVRGE